MDIPKDKYACVFEFLEILQKETEDKGVHNTLLFFRSEERDTTDLI